MLIEKKNIKNLITTVAEFQKKKWNRKQISEAIREKLG
jgi:hypothetical protein